jgi:S-DNA-T family DNA segregation ATPase FtsK/SpoIIIE
VAGDRHHSSVTAFTLPMTVAVVDGSAIRYLPIALRVPGPVPWSVAAATVGAAAGLPPGAVLFLGVGQVEADWIVGAPPLLAGVTLYTRPADRIAVAAPLALAVVGGPDAGGSVALGRRPVTVGRASVNELIVDDPAVSATHAVVAASATGLLIRDLGSTNGIRVDGQVMLRPTQDMDTPAGSLVRLGGSLLRAGLTTEAPASTEPDGRGHLVVHRVPAARIPDPPDPAPPPPPPERPRRSVPLLAAVISALLGGGLALVLGSWLYLAVAALGPLTMVASALGERASGQRRQRRDRREHARRTAAWSVATAAAQRARRDAAWERHPDPATLLRRAQEVRAGLWSSHPDDPDRLCLAIGVDTGEWPASGAAGPTRPPRRRPARRRQASSGPVGSDRTAAMPDSPAEVPMVIDLARIGVLGLVGEATPLLRWLLLQAACLVSPQHLWMTVFSDRPDLLCCDDLPHSIGAGRPIDLAGPAAPSSVSGVTPRPDWLIVVDGMSRWRSDPRVAALLAMASRGRRPGGAAVVVLCLADHREDLPAGCACVEARSGALHLTGSDLDRRSPAGRPRRLALTGISADRFRQAISALAALTDAADRARVPGTSRFGELHGPITAAELRRRWSKPTVAARIGVTARGPLEWDLDRDGPHLLVAGTTGSGKSELLLTLVAGLAAAAPPDRMSFLLIDYKGGAAFTGLNGLPHVTAVVTDLDGPLAGRALLSLRAELRRRERIARDGTDPPARLVVVVDEFAVLARELPAFLTELMDIAQRGRSLGLHLVLATQRPSGVVSPAIRANVATRICLRVTDPADSTDVIGVPAASEIPASTPGRALIRTADQPSVLFQAARVTAPADPGVAAWRRDHSGPSPGGIHSDGPGEARSELDRLVTAVRQAAHGIDSPPPPWVPPLPDRVRSDEVGRECLAMVDRPDRQCRTTLTILDGSVLVIGDPRSGRSTALARIASTAAASGARLILIDPRGDLAARRWPAADTVLDGTDPVLVGRVLELIGAPPRDLQREPILLVIDGWEDLVAGLDAADQGATTARLLRLFDAGPAGIRVAASGRRSLEHHPVAHRAAHLIELGAGGETTPGRGCYQGNCLQVVLPPAEPVSTSVGDMSSAANRGTRPGRAHPVAPRPPDRIVIRALPVEVALRDLPIGRAESVPIGLGGDAALLVTIDLAGPGGAWVIAGPRRGGVSTTLLTLAAGAAAAGIPVLWAAPVPVVTQPDGRSDHGRSAGPLDAERAGAVALAASGRPPPWRTLHSAAELRSALAEHRGPLALFADTPVLDLDRRGRPGCDPSDPSGDPALADLLVRFCRVCGPGQHLVLGTRPEAVTAAFHGPVAEALAFRRAILLDADAADGPRLGVRLPRRTVRPIPGRGFLIRDGEATPVQIARPGPA